MTKSSVNFLRQELREVNSATGWQNLTEKVQARWKIQEGAFYEISELASSVSNLDRLYKAALMT